MEKGKFLTEKMSKGHLNWDKCIAREKPIEPKPDDIRSPFYRDYTRVLHSHAYSRLKHKTQVFFATQNDHICTRMEHVHHVASVSYTIAEYLGLNTELAQAIALSHDIGHTPFGHEGESQINKICTNLSKGNASATANLTEEEKETSKNFWHEQNGLRVVDKIATLRDSNNIYQNFSLTYAVRDGIVCHCGEVDENAIRPRTEYIDNLYTITAPPKGSPTVAPYTWEGCVVKLSDKIAYLGRDIQDALELNILGTQEKLELREIIFSHLGSKIANNTVLISGLILDLCENSRPEAGLQFSKKYFELIKDIKDFNYKYIYKHQRIQYYKRYVGNVIDTIYHFLASYVDIDKGEKIWKGLGDNVRFFPLSIGHFQKWLIKYSDIDTDQRIDKHENRIIYDIHEKEDRRQAIIDFIAGMSDSFAIKVYQEIVAF